MKHPFKRKSVAWRVMLAIPPRARATRTTYRVARQLSVPWLHAVWVAACYFFTGRTINYKIKDTQWRVTP